MWLDNKDAFTKRLTLAILQMWYWWVCSSRCGFRRFSAEARALLWSPREPLRAGNDKHWCCWMHQPIIKHSEGPTALQAHWPGLIGGAYSRHFPTDKYLNALKLLPDVVFIPNALLKLFLTQNFYPVKIYKHSYKIHLLAKYIKENSFLVLIFSINLVKKKKEKKKAIG